MMSRFKIIKHGIRKGIRWSKNSAVLSPLLSVYHKFSFQSNLRENDVFLVGHPKSGNTWLAYMLAILIQNDKHLHVTLANIGEYIPVIHGRDYRIGDYHDLVEPRVFRNEWPIYPESYPRTIYLVRDPRAVLVSYYHMFKVFFPEHQITLEEYVEEYLSKRYMMKFEPRLISWDQQVLAWTERAEHDKGVIIVKYEDMVHNLEEVLERVADFAGISFKKKDLAFTLARGSFDAMQVDERKHGAEAYKGRQGQFIRRGKVDSWKEEMSTYSAARIESHFKMAMGALGYPSWASTHSLSDNDQRVI